MANKKPPYVVTLPLGKLFIDEANELIFVNNVRRPQPPNSPGYQRDPYEGGRDSWLSERAEHYSGPLARPIDVSKRDDGTYAIIDGGGRWLMAERAGKTHIDCRVHEGLTRKEESILYVQFDKQIYRQRPVDRFLAALSYDPVAKAIAEDIKPFTVAKSGKGTLNCVGLLGTIYNGGKGARTLRRTALIAANTWGKYKSGEFLGEKVTGPEFGALAICLDIAPSGWDEGPMRAACSRADLTPRKLSAWVDKRVSGSGRMNGVLHTITSERMRIGADILAKRANTTAKVKLDRQDIKTSDLLDRIENHFDIGRTGGSW